MLVNLHICKIDSDKNISNLSGSKIKNSIHRLRNLYNIKLTDDLVNSIIVFNRVTVRHYALIYDCHTKQYYIFDYNKHSDIVLYIYNKNMDNRVYHNLCRPKDDINKYKFAKLYINNTDKKGDLCVNKIEITDDRVDGNLYEAMDFVLNCRDGIMFKYEYEYSNNDKKTTNTKKKTINPKYNNNNEESYIFSNKCTHIKYTTFINSYVKNNKKYH